MQSSFSSRVPWPAAGLAVAVLSLLLLVYVQGFGNGFVFDDDRLFDGTIANGYGEEAAFNWRRWLSYSSFIWLGMEDSSWGWQRGLNLLLHALVVLGLYGLWVQLLDLLPAPEAKTQDEQRSLVRMGVMVGVAVFALNPVAVYAVAYLIQRSIVMATLFSVLALACMVRGIVQDKWFWHLLALGAYALAVMSKEHAIMLPLAAVVVAVFVHRPSLKQSLAWGSVGALALGMCAWLMWQKLGSVVGVAAFDEISRAYVQQLSEQHPNFEQHAYGLSVMNQAALFFKYGALWLLPNPQWLSIDLRPVFPVSFVQMPQLLGAFGFVALGLLSLWGLLTRKGAWQLACVCVLGAQALFMSEFVTTWLQDPFVLYRSYLWAMFLPGLLALLLLSCLDSIKAMGLLGLIVALPLSAVTWDRVQSLRTAQLAWADAAAKIDLNAPMGAVGRWRPVLNQGAEQLERGNWGEAIRSFALAESLGEPFGGAAMNHGVALQNAGEHVKALQLFQKAIDKGMKHDMVPYHQAISQRALGDIPAALSNFEKASKLAKDKELKLKIFQDWGDTAIAARMPDRADQAFNAMMVFDPGNVRAEVGKGMALLARQQPDAALTLFDASLSRQESSAGHYGRGLALMMKKEHQSALEAAQKALSMEPGNRRYQSFVQYLQRMGVQ